MIITLDPRNNQNKFPIYLKQLCTHGLYIIYSIYSIKNKNSCGKSLYISFFFIKNKSRLLNSYFVKSHMRYQYNKDK
jgi:hypothetical protein